MMARRQCLRECRTQSRRDAQSCKFQAKFRAHTKWGWWWWCKRGLSWERWLPSSSSSDRQWEAHIVQRVLQKHRLWLVWVQKWLMQYYFQFPRLSKSGWFVSRPTSFQDLVQPWLVDKMITKVSDLFDYDWENSWFVDWYVRWYNRINLYRMITISNENNVKRNMFWNWNL